jgi:23S rRNA-/tRNA-specific pseudouridylate synthase
VSAGAQLQASAIAVLYRDDHLLVLDKPVGIATTAPEGGASLFALARTIDPTAPALHPLSRLDTQVSGIVTFARTASANRVALEARQNGSLRRAYLGLTARAPEPLQGDWRFAIGIDPRDARKRTAAPDGSEGRALKVSHTHYRTHANAGPLVALDLWPLTGRTHQLRVHASAAGCPLLGDVAYGGAKRLTLANGRILSAGRTMLHCAAFRMPNPARPAESIALALAPPEDLCTLWRAGGGDPADLALQL